jgi:hypothetical protein
VEVSNDMEFILNYMTIGQLMYSDVGFEVFMAVIIKMEGRRVASTL